MVLPTRRAVLGLLVGAAAAERVVAAPLLGSGAPDSAQPGSRARARWGRGFEGQRCADRGDGTFLNPIMAGAYSDPSILKDGADYYMTFSTFEADPGLLIWHSRDLVNWRPFTTALSDPLGSVFAVDLVKHDGRYFIYIPFVPTSWSTRVTGNSAIYVIHATDIRGPWSEPVDTGIRGYIDPGHAVGEDGERYLLLSGGHRVRLTPDGLRAVGQVEKVYDGWRYPDDWVTEAYALEGPKILKRGAYFYLVSAVGGTAGPPTGHMVIAARSRSIHGPWENCPQNPLVRTRSAQEAWWSRGHATLVEGPAGDWWLVYHGFENGFRTLGRQTLLDPVVWTSDGWFRAKGGDLSQPLRKPRGGQGQPHGLARSDDFRVPALGDRWTFHAPGKDEARRARFGEQGLLLTARGTGPHDGSPLTNPVGDRSYEASVELELLDGAMGGLLLFLSSRLFVGVAIDGEKMITYGGGRIHHWREKAPAARKMHLRVVNNEHIVTFYYSLDGQNWARHGLRMETSGYNINTTLMGEGENLRPALFAARAGAVRFRDFRYRAI